MHFNTDGAGGVKIHKHILKTAVINIWVYSIGTVHEASTEAEKDVYVMNYLRSASRLGVKSASWVKEEDIKNTLSNVFIRYSNAEHGGDWLLDQLALKEELSGVTNTFSNIAKWMHKWLSKQSL